MYRIQDRLKEVRDRHDLSLRGFVEKIEEESGYEISHSAVRKYENGQRPPADYIRAIANVFSVDVRWLLAGEDEEFPESSLAIGDLRDQLESLLARIPESGSAESSGARSREEISAEWAEAVRTWDRKNTRSPLVLRSHARSAEAGVPEEAERARCHRVADDELERRRKRNSDLLETAAPHLRWFSALLATVPHVVYLTDADGVILEAAGDEDLVSEWCVTPGCDWSEERMGTNGAGTALEVGRPIAIIGEEHYNRAFRDVTCLGVPIQDADETIRGAIDVATENRFGCPRRLLPAVYVGWVIGRELDPRRSE